MKIQPYIIIPNLIEQPTWGGFYIPQLKKITNPQLKNKKIGQSYELYEFTNLSAKTSTKNNPSLELGNSKQPQQSQKLTSNDKIFNINQLIKQNPLAVLGKKVIKKHNHKIKILIKFTQAKGNSYQIHIKKKTKAVKWFPKPESWYYFEPGLVTLGAKPKVNWQTFQQTCHGINNLAKQLSQKVKSKKISLDQAKKQLQDYISQHNPEKFVNLIRIAKNQSIDLSPCGIHHSWEENSQLIPNGNIVYEVQLNVYDSDSTIRCFDKGKIKNDGSIRNLQIDDYFKHIDHSQEANNPKTHMRKSTIIKKTSTYTIKQILQTSNYSLQKIKFTQPINNQHTQTQDSYHHLFAKQGNIQLKANDNQLIITQGFSVFIPASTGQYQLNPLSSKAVVLKTYLN